MYYVNLPIVVHFKDFCKQSNQWLNCTNYLLQFMAVKFPSPCIHHNHWSDSVSSNMHMFFLSVALLS